MELPGLQFTILREGAVQNYLLQEDSLMLEELVENNFFLQNVFT